MANFFNYRNVNFSIEDEKYYANKINLSAKSSVSAVILNDGTLLNYAPEGAVVGSLDIDFYLTGSIPSYLNITGTNESAISGKFANISITGLYAKSISFSVKPFNPILISANFDWYGNVDVANFEENTQADKNNVSVPNYIANSYKSYLNKQDIEGVNHIVEFSYEASCDRPAFFYVDEKIPFRVGKLNKNVSVSLSSDTLGELIDIDGKTAIGQVVIKDFYGTNLNTFNISGVLTTQNYQVNEGQYMLASAQLTQTVVENKTLI